MFMEVLRTGVSMCPSIDKRRITNLRATRAIVLRAQAREVLEKFVNNSYNDKVSDIED